MLEIGTELTKGGPSGRVHVRVVRVPNHLIVCSIGDDPLILAIFDLERVDKLLFEGVRVLADEELRLLTEV